MWQRHCLMKNKMNNNQHKIKALEAKVALTTADEKEIIHSKILKSPYSVRTQTDKHCLI